jgi:hypothetical protein
LRSRHWLVWMAVVFAAGCGKKAQRAQELGDQAGGVAEESRAPQVRMPYVIPEAGVHFNPPLSWDPDRIQVVTLSGTDAAAQERGADYAVSFNYKAEQPAHENASLLRLLVLRRSQWTRIADDAAPGEVIDSTGEWVFVASLPQKSPYRPDLLDADQFTAMQMSLDEVRDAFTIESGGPTNTSISQRR